MVTLQPGSARRQRTGPKQQAARAERGLLLGIHDYKFKMLFADGTIHYTTDVVFDDTARIEPIAATDSGNGGARLAQPPPADANGTCDGNGPDSLAQRDLDT